MPSCFGLVRFSAAEQEHHVGVVRGAGPDLLAIHHEVSVLQYATGLQ